MQIVTSFWVQVAEKLLKDIVPGGAPQDIDLDSWCHTVMQLKLMEWCAMST